jgi:hypothetical protein
MTAFTYELTAKLGGAYASKTLKITLEDADGSVVNFEDATAFKVHDGSTCKIREKGNLGTYHIWCDQWPLGSLPFTVLVKNNADDSFIDSVDFNLADLARESIADFGPAPAGEYDTEMTLLYHVAGGRWRIVDNQMIFYEADNVTEVMRFDLKNLAGEAAMADVFERVRV